jgi:hypothetical protein
MKLWNWIGALLVQGRSLRVTRRAIMPKLRRRSAWAHPRRGLALCGPEVMEGRWLFCVTPTPMPFDTTYPVGHSFEMQGMTLANGTTTTTGITDTATPSIVLSITTPPANHAGHDFEIDVKDNGQTIGTLIGHQGDLTTGLMVPISAATPLQPGENDLRFKLTDVTAGLSVPIPAASDPPIVIVYDNAPPVVTLTPAPAAPPAGVSVVNAAATDLEDGLTTIQITDQYSGRADKVTTPFSGPCDTQPPATNYTFDPAELGPHTLIVQATDRAGRATTVSGTYTVLPAVLPTPNPPSLEPASDSELSQTDGITNAQNLTFDVTGAIAPDATVQLLRNGTVVATRTGPGALTDVDVPESSGDQYTARQLGANSSASPQSAAVTIVVDRTAPTGTVSVQAGELSYTGDSLLATTQISPDLPVSITTPSAQKPNAVILSLLSIDGAAPAVASSTQVVIPAGQTAPASQPVLPIPVSLAPGVHTVVVQATDAAGNVASLPSLQFVVLAGPPAGAPSTPVFNTVFDLTKLPGYNPAQREYPWSVAFDRTTQTVWIALRGGDENSGFNGGGEQVAQLDPATGQVQIYSLRALDGQAEPHGVAFDFESNLDPRFWFTEREAGYVSYLDLTTNQLVSYDLGAILRSAGYGKADVHAIAIDAHGNAWVSDMDDKVLIELDFHHYPNQPSDLPFGSDSGTLTIHPLPPQLVLPSKLPPKPGQDLTGPHGIGVETSDQTGEDYVWFSDLGINGGAALLRPGAGPGGSDLWTSWNVLPALGTNPNGGTPLFVNVDTSEEPGYLPAERVVFTDPGGSGEPNNLVRELTPGAPDASGNFGPATLLTWQIPAAPGSGGAMAQPNQAFPDREGNLVYIDRQSGVGRLDPNGSSLTNIENTNTVLPTNYPAVGGANLTQYMLTPFRVLDDAAIHTTANLPATPSTIADSSTIAGLDQYVTPPVSPVSGGSQGAGPFRSVLSAGSTIFGSLTQSDNIQSTVFAEMVRRPVAVVNGPGDARRVFQVLRSGDIIMTWHGPGQTVDQQVDLTTAVGGPTFVGDPTASTDSKGVVEVFGRDSEGGIAEYRFDPTTQAWTTQLLPPPAASSGQLAADTTSYTDPQGNVLLLTTTGTGHLLEYNPQSGQVVDLSALPAWSSSGPVYSTAGVTQLGSSDYVYATNQTGSLVQAVLGPSGALLQTRLLTIPGGRATEVFQDVTALTQGTTQYIFACDGASRMVATTIGSGGQISAENVSVAVEAAGTAVGYSAYQMPWAGRVYGDLSAAVDPTNGDIYVEGTNGRDLVEFRLPSAPNSQWQVTDLTNALPANKVFGTPAIYILPNGDRHILMINEQAELIEYYNLVPGQISTQNITLASGNSGSPPIFPMSFNAAGQTAPLPLPVPVASTSHLTHHRGKHHPKGPVIASHHPSSASSSSALSIGPVHSKHRKKQPTRRAAISAHLKTRLAFPRRARLVADGARKPH